jgi:CheY-like chemotaxis protein
LRSYGFRPNIEGVEMLPAQRILVVDNEPPLVELVRGYLAREGFEIVTAVDGPTAVPEKT